MRETVNRLADRLLDAERRVAAFQYEKEAMTPDNAALEPVHQQVRRIDGRLSALDQDIQNLQHIQGLDEDEVKTQQDSVANAEVVDPTVRQVRSEHTGPAMFRMDTSD
eukprot:9928424-Lingulodinium_polyedra.AAC.1